MVKRKQNTSVLIKISHSKTNESITVTGILSKHKQMVFIENPFTGTKLKTRWRKLAGGSTAKIKDFTLKGLSPLNISYGGSSSRSLEISKKFSKRIGEKVEEDTNTKSKIEKYTAHA